MSTRPVKDVVRGTHGSRALRFLTRVGFAVNGLVHVIIGFIAIGVATGAGGSADHSGALGGIAASPGGGALLWVTTVGLAALGLWLILGAFLMPSRDAKRRVAHFLVEAGKGLAYLLIAGTALTFALGGSADSETEVDTVSANLLAAPGGVLVLGCLGLLVLGVGAYFVVKGVRRRFVDDIALPGGKLDPLIIGVGVFGYVAKGAALAFTGLLIVVAAFRADPSQVEGLDGSLKALAELPAGQLILIVIGSGVAAYGAYCLVRAKVARL